MDNKLMTPAFLKLVALNTACNKVSNAYSRISHNLDRNELSLPAGCDYKDRFDIKDDGIAIIAMQLEIVLSKIKIDRDKARIEYQEELLELKFEKMNNIKQIQEENENK